jgi:hypothetical protein
LPAAAAHSAVGSELYCTGYADTGAMVNLKIFLKIIQNHAKKYNQSLRVNPFLSNNSKFLIKY